MRAEFVELADVPPKRARQRQGIATLVALITISITLAVCAALLRVQTTSRVVQHNARRTELARQAAATGLHAAITRMHESSWGGVGVAVPSVQIDANTRYEISYAAGDSSLTAAQPLWHLRVTVQSKGVCTSLHGPDVEEHAEAVVQLTPRWMAPEPVGWSQLADATVLQWGTSSLDFELPARVEGLLRSYGPIDIAASSPVEANQPFRGRIDEVALWSSALTAANVWQLYFDCLLGQLTNSYSSLAPDSWWRLGEASGATASNEAYGYQGEYIGPSLGAAGCPGETGNLSPQFDGHNDQVRVGDDGNFSNLTVVAWINEDEAGDQASSCVAGRAAGDAPEDQSWSLSTTDVAGVRRLQFQVRANDVLHTLTGSTAIVPGTWHFVAATYDGANLRLYVNGFAAGSITATGAIQHPINSVMMIGDRPPGSSRAAYLRGLKDDSNSAMVDKLFPGSIETPVAGLSSLNLDLLTNVMGAVVNDLTPLGQAPASFPGLPAAYQLYDGGPTYSATVISGFVSNASFAPTATNPLGVVVANSDVTLGNNVNFQGCLVVAGSLTLDGTGIVMAPVVLPALDGAVTPIELPLLAIEDDLIVGDSAGVVLNGLILALRELRVDDGANAQLNIVGTAATERLRIRPRSDWSQDSNWWTPHLAQWNYDDSQGLASDTFPYYLEAFAHSVAPEAAFSPRPSPATYHWHDWAAPLFMPAPTDASLRWSVVRWRRLNY